MTASKNARGIKRGIGDKVEGLNERMHDVVFRGWSVNLSIAAPAGVFELKLPVPSLWIGRLGPMLELVFWAETVERWVHCVSEHFERQLPEGHVQVTLGDLEWLRGVVARFGEEGLRECVRDLEEVMLPSLE